METPLPRPKGLVRLPLRRETIVTLLLLAGFWQFLSFFFPPYLLPGFQELVPQLGKTLAAPITYQHIGVSFSRTVVSLLAAVVVGTGLGVVMGISRRLESYLAPVVRFIMGVPALSWILVAVIWFRQMEVRVFFVIFAIALPIMILNTLDGIKAIPKDLYDMLLSFRPSLWQRIRMIVVPGAAPYILVGTKVALSFTIRLVVFAELIGTTHGIGSAMYTAFQTFNLTGIFIWTGLLVVLLYVLSGILDLLERRVLKWRPESIRTA